MRERVEIPKAPSDRLTLTSEGRFSGVSYVYENINGNFQPKEVAFDLVRKNPLSPFVYNKPIPGEKPTDQPIRFDMDQKPREGNYPLALVKNARRLPNHFYQDENGILTAVKVNGQWETRFYPKSCLESATWDEALKLLGISEQE